MQCLVQVIKPDLKNLNANKFGADTHTSHLNVGKHACVWFMTTHKHFLNPRVTQRLDENTGHGFFHTNVKSEWYSNVLIIIMFMFPRISFISGNDNTKT